MVALHDIVSLFTSLAQYLYLVVLLGSCGALFILFLQQDCSVGVGLVSGSLMHGIFFSKSQAALLIEGSTGPCFASFLWWWQRGAWLSSSGGSATSQKGVFSLLIVLVVLKLLWESLWDQAVAASQLNPWTAAALSARNEWESLTANLEKAQALKQ